jgi:hypothetical protein
MRRKKVPDVPLVRARPAVSCDAHILALGAPGAKLKPRSTDCGDPSPHGNAGTERIRPSHGATQDHRSTSSYARYRPAAVAEAQRTNGSTEVTHGQ